MTDQTYQKFLHHWERVVDLPPQTMGSFTPYYKKVARFAKTMPWPLFVLLSIIIVVCIYGLLGSAVSYVASLLQKGF